MLCLFAQDFLTFSSLSGIVVLLQLLNIHRYGRSSCFIALPWRMSHAAQGSEQAPRAQLVGIVEHTWIACWVTLLRRSCCCVEALSVQQSILRMVYSSSKRKFPNALHTWTSDSFSSSLKLVSGSAPVLFWHMSVTLWLMQMRGVWCSLIVVLWRNVWLIELKRKNCFGL